MTLLLESRSCAGPRSLFSSSALVLSAAFGFAGCDNGNGNGSGPDENTSAGGMGTNTGAGGSSDPATGGNPSTGGSANVGGSGGSGGTGGDTTDVRLPGTDNYDCSPPEGTVPELTLVPYVDEGLDNPVYVTHAPNETDRLFVLEQAGRIKVVHEGVVNEDLFLDLTGQVDQTTWEQGLLGLAFHPNFEQNGLFYVHYNSAGVAGHPDGSSIISEFQVSDDDPDVADATSERIVLGEPTSDVNSGFHNGGSIVFGPDDFLFIALGDGGDSENGQDATNVRGGISRIDPLQAGDDPYTIPSGNLADVMSDAAPELWDFGLRNPYRINFDACTGHLYIGDVGDRAWEEVNVEPRGEGNFNYGWAILEGDECYDEEAESCPEPERYRGPMTTHPNNEAGGPQFQSVVGGSVYRGSAIPALRGTYFFTDLYGNTRIFTYDAQMDTISEVESLESQLNPAEDDQGLVAIQNGGDGELYFVSRGGSGMGLDPLGVIFKLEAAD